MSKRPWLYVLGAVVLVLAVGVGALGGAAVTYAIMRVPPVRAAIGLAQEAPDPDAGLLIARVVDDSAAAAAGVVRGDILLEVDGNKISSLAELQTALSDSEPGDSVTLTVLHGDELRSLEATLGDQDGRAALGVIACGCERDVDLLGPALRFSDPEARERFREALVVGAEVAEVVPDSPADEAGLAVGDIIVSVDGELIGAGDNLASLVQTYEPGDRVVLGVMTGDEAEPRDVTVTLGENPEQEGQAYLGIRYTPSASMRGFRWEEVPFFDEDGESEGELPEDFDLERFFRGLPGLPGMPGLPGDVELPEGVESAAIIGEVLPDTPAEEAGLVVGDVVLAIDGESLDGPEALVEAVSQCEPGDRVSLTLFRGGEEVDVSVTLGENPENAGAAYLGVRVTGFISVERSERRNGPLDFDFDFDFGFDERLEELDLPDLGNQDA